MDVKGICAFTAAMTMLSSTAMPQPAMAGVKRFSATERIALQQPTRSPGHVNRSRRSISRWYSARTDKFPRRRYHRRPILPPNRFYESGPTNPNQIQPPPTNDRGRIVPAPPGDVNRVPPGQPAVPLPPGVYPTYPGWRPVMGPK